MSARCPHESVVTHRSVPPKSVCDECGLEVRRIWVSENEGVVTRETMESVDRNARAYGWEIGRKGELTDTTKTSPENPFLDPDWRDRL